MPDMRFAPPKQLRIADRTDGFNPGRVRSYNERLVLSLLLQHDGISRLEIGNRTKLSAQTVSVIVRSLEHEGLLLRGAAMRGRVGPPTIPVLLNPDGAYSIGVDLAPWENEVVLIDLMGRVRFHTKLSVQENGYTATSSAVRTAIIQALDILPADARERVAGIGVALLDNSDVQTGKLIDSAEVTNLYSDLEQEFGLPVFMQNDVTAATGGEMMFGVTKSMSDHLFCFLGAALHYRLVLNNHVYTGNYTISPANLDVGLIALQRRAGRNETSMLNLYDNTEWKSLGEALDRWRSECVGALKGSVRALAQFVDINTVVLSAAVPQVISDAICADLRRAIPSLQVRPGAVQKAPKAVGAASLPFISRFTLQN